MNGTFGGRHGGAWVRWNTERVVRVLAGACLAGSVLIMLTGDGLLTSLPGGSACSFARETGRACPACGATRAFRMAVRGDWDEALRLNWIGSGAALALWLLVLGSAVALLSASAALLQGSVVVSVLTVLVALLAGVARWWAALGGA
jgi:hypothetical protein